MIFQLRAVAAYDGGGKRRLRPRRVGRAEIEAKVTRILNITLLGLC